MEALFVLLNMIKPLPEDLKSYILSKIKRVEVKKGHVFLKEGQVCLFPGHGSRGPQATLRLNFYKNLSTRLLNGSIWFAATGNNEIARAALKKISKDQAIKWRRHS